MVSSTTNTTSSTATDEVTAKERVGVETIDSSTISIISEPPSKEQQQQQTQIVRDCIALLRQEGIRCVAFDMDFTAVARHSRGRLRRDGLHSEYLDYAVQPFVELVPALHAAGIHVAVTTHSDEAELDDNSTSTQTPRIHRSTHILGRELVQALLQRYVNDPHVMREVFVVAYNPRVRGTQHDAQNKLKRFHMRQVLEHFFPKQQQQPSLGGVNALEQHQQHHHHHPQAREILLLDDTAEVVRDCRHSCGVRAIQVSQPATHGLQWSDLFRLGTSAESADYKG